METKEQVIAHFSEMLHVVRRRLRPWRIACGVMAAALVAETIALIEILFP